MVEDNRQDTCARVFQENSSPTDLPGTRQDPILKVFIRLRQGNPGPEMFIF